MIRPRPALLGAAGGAGLALAVLTAGPAIAAASLSVTAAGSGQPVTVAQPQTSNDVLDIRGQIDPNTSTTQLVVTDPNGSSHVVASGSAPVTQGSTLSYALNTACLSYDPKQSPCSGSNPALNGVWTVRLQGGESASEQFALRIPPATPQNVSATGASDDKTVTVTWQANTEPDLTGYDVLDGSGQVLAGNLSPGQVCNGGTCSTQVSAPGASSVAVDAHRTTCPGCSQTLTSAPSQPAAVAWPSPSPAPSSAPSTSGSGSGASGPGPSGSGSHGATTGSGSGSGSGGAGTTTGGRTGSAPSASSAGAANAGALLQQMLPGPSAAAPPVVPQPAGGLPPGEAEPTVWGTYSPTLGYGPKTVGQLVTVPYQGAPQLAGAAPAAVSWFSPMLWRSLAEGLLLLVVAGHVAAWLRRGSIE